MADLDALKAFLLARLDEEKALAETGDQDSPTLTLQLDDDMRWISVTPARILADVEAKRLVVKRWPDPFGNWTAEQAEAARAMKLETLKALALPYAYHADFRSEWAPAWWRDEHATKTEAPQ
jgi:hypothetical protein